MTLYFGITFYVLFQMHKRFSTFPKIYQIVDMFLFAKISIIDTKYAFVSCYYPIKSGRIRHTIDEYKYRISKLFDVFNKSLQLFIFTNNEGRQILESSRIVDNRTIPFESNIKMIIKYNSVFDIPKIAERRAEYEEIGEIMQKSCNYNVSAEIGGIWNAKIIFLQEVIENYSSDSKLFFWVDIGIFKTEDMARKIVPNEWPCVRRIEKIFAFETNPQSPVKTYTNKILIWALVRPFERARSIDQVNINAYERFVMAGFMGGPREKMLYLLNEYWKIQDVVIKKKQFVLREELMLGGYMTLNKNDVFLFNTNGKQRCSIGESCIGFTYHSNVCRFENSVYVYVTRGGRYLPVEKPLGDWL